MRTTCCLKIYSTLAHRAGREWNLKYQLKRAESRNGRTRSLTGWRPLSAAMGLAAGDVLAIERVSEPRALPLLLTVRVLARGLPPAAPVAAAEAGAEGSLLARCPSLRPPNPAP